MIARQSGGGAARGPNIKQDLISGDAVPVTQRGGAKTEAEGSSTWDITNAFAGRPKTSRKGKTSK